MRVSPPAFLSILFGLLLSADIGLAQVALVIDTLTVDPGETFEMSVRVDGFADLSSAQFELAWDPTVAQLLDGSMPVDTFASDSHFNLNAGVGSVRFLYITPSGRGGGVLPQGAELIRLRLRAIGSAGEQTAVTTTTANIALEFIRDATEELDVSVRPGRVHLRGTSSLASPEQPPLLTTWASPSGLLVSHREASSATPVTLVVSDLAGRELRRVTVVPGSTRTHLEFPSGVPTCTRLALSIAEANRSQSTLILTRCP